MNTIKDKFIKLAEENPEQAKSLVDWMMYQIELEQKSNKEIAELLLRDVWAEMDMTSRASSIVGEAIDRLRGGE